MMPSAPPTSTAAAAADLAAPGVRVHCIGIGGCGLSGLARVLAEAGAVVSGSDDVPGELTADLERHGIPVSTRRGAAALPQRCDAVIASAAFKPDHPEMLEARRRGLRILGYAEALGRVQAARTGVSIAGTHGKSTTAAMLCHVLIRCGLDPSFIVGATCPQIGGGSRTGSPLIPGDGPMAGRPGILVAEACEFNRSFHHHRPLLALINNIEEDHLDVYGSLDAIIEAFAALARLVPPARDSGKLLIAHEGAHRQRVTAGLECAVTTLGFNPQADVHVRYESASQRVTVSRDDGVEASWRNLLPGAHTALNAAAAGVLATGLGADWGAAAEALATFAGVDRRMQRLGTRKLVPRGGGGAGGTVTVYDDYGHHPTEIDATLRALRAAERPARLICVFQPHQHSRTRTLMEGFARAFSAADLVLVPHIYFVRDPESEKSRVSAADLVENIKGQGTDAVHIDSFDAVVERLERDCRDGDLVVIMGAGPVWKIARDFLG